MNPRDAAKAAAQIVRREADLFFGVTADRRARHFERESVAFSAKMKLVMDRIRPPERPLVKNGAHS